MKDHSPTVSPEIEGQPGVLNDATWVVPIVIAKRSAPHRMAVSIGVKLTRLVGVKLTRLGEDGGFLAADHADSRAESGNQGFSPPGRGDSGYSAAAGLLAQHGQEIFERG